ncbi:MAG: Fic family protein [Planctomycetota bacterium]
MTGKAKGTGRLIRCPEGYRAFMPAALPPKLDWTVPLVKSLSDADRAVGQLAGEGSRLPNPHLLMRPFLQREAVLSSKIEGTQATLGELLAAEAGVEVERSPEEMREVANYVAAMEHGMQQLQKVPLSLRLVRSIHEKLMQGARGGHATPGEFRRSQNWIGPPGSTLKTASYVPPPPVEMKEALGQWETFLHDTSLPPLVQIAMAHYQFESIHPFLDGNGRVGRLLIILFLIERSVLCTPLLYLSAFFEATRQEYYDRLRGVSEQAQWTEWIVYFLRGVCRQSTDVLDRAKRINTILDGWRVELAGSRSAVPASIVELLAENPFWTIKRIAERLGVAFTTAQRAVDKLVSASILYQTTTGKRDRVYCAKAILDVLEESTAIA